jgi:FixJ family two-component response regulator
MECIKHGAKDYITKPVDKKILLTKISKILGIDPRTLLV